jgi:predicted AAA+ superfamily ATPase
MFLKRLLNLANLLNKKSFFLFGPRATGKSSLIRQQLGSEALILDLLRSDLYLHLASRPQDLEAIIDAETSQPLVVIDEFQRLPELLNEVHRLIENRGIRFLLTGSSARKLRQHHVNLLAGRAREAWLLPLVSQEIPNFELDRYLQYGGLPPVYLGEEPQEELIAYVDTYLKEEIQAESWVRKIPAFSRFLQTAALTNGEILNFTNIASDTGVPVSTVREYYHILEDTFIGFLLPAWTKSVKRKAISTAKFYFFDLGVSHTLARIQSLEPASDLYGRAFEHFIALELRAYLSYNRIHKTMSYWRSKHGHEVDFILGDEVAIEVKSATNAQDKHCKGLNALLEEGICQRYLLISRDKINRRHKQIEYLYWEDFLKKLWDNQIL